MHRELLSHTPLLALPIGALFLFLGVFIAVVVQAMVRRRESYADVERLPFCEEEEADHGAE